MSYIKYFYDELIKFQQEIDNLPYSENDLRKAYFEITLACLAHNYDHYSNMLLGDHINNGEVIFKDSAKESIIHFERLTKVVADRNLFINSRNSANRKLILDAWSMFEFSITFLCDKILDAKSIDELLEYEYNDVLDIIKKYSISKNDQLKLKRKFRKNHLTHVPITRKYDKLYKLYKGKFDCKNDIEFLKFCGKYRNGMHSNFWYQGSDFEYTFMGVTIYFKNESPITTSVETDIRFFFNLILELKNVTKRLFDLIDYTEFIEYPLDIEPMG